jgi:hypothetical protein
MAVELEYERLAVSVAYLPTSLRLPTDQPIEDVRRRVARVDLINDCFGIH